jgi:DNA polymerase-3 subunit delta'
MPDLLFHPASHYQIEAIINTQPQAVLMSGRTGAGKQTAAQYIASRVLDVSNPETYPYYLEVLPEKGSIGIEQARQIKAMMKRKTTGERAVRRVIVVVDAHTMTADAQNAMLKTLEEPPADTVIILTTGDVTALKPTIRSRSQHVTILPVAKEAAITYFTGLKHANDAVESAYALSGGEVGLLAALLADEAEHPLAAAIHDAKDVLKASKYERLLRIDAISKQKEQLMPLLDGLQRVVTSGLRQSASLENHAQTKRFYELSQSVMQAQQRASQNVNTKLLLTDLFLSM